MWRDVDAEYVIFVVDQDESFRRVLPANFSWKEWSKYALYETSSCGMLLHFRAPKMQFKIPNGGSAYIPIEQLLPVSPPVVTKPLLPLAGPSPGPPSETVGGVLRGCFCCACVVQEPVRLTMSSAALTVVPFVKHYEVHRLHVNVAVGASLLNYLQVSIEREECVEAKKMMFNRSQKYTSVLSRVRVDTKAAAKAGRTSYEIEIAFRVSVPSGVRGVSDEHFAAEAVTVESEPDEDGIVAVRYPSALRPITTPTLSFPNGYLRYFVSVLPTTEGNYSLPSGLLRGELLVVPVANGDLAVNSGSESSIPAYVLRGK
jgi:hypothetical protein